MEENFLSSEEYRHQCEVRALIKNRITYGKQYLVDFLNQKAVKGRRAKLEQDILEQWNKGNRGEHGTWL
jgi:hypothetical protein